MKSQVVSHMGQITDKDVISDIVENHGLQEIEHAIVSYYGPNVGTEVRGVRSGTEVDLILETTAGFAVIYVDGERLRPEPVERIDGDYVVTAIQREVLYHPHH